MLETPQSINPSPSLFSAFLQLPQLPTMTSKVSSDVGRLKRLIIHGLDESHEKLLPMRAQEFLFEDIIDVPRARNEYTSFARVLLYFLDEQNARLLANVANFANPFSADYFRSEKLIDFVWLLRDVLALDTASKLSIVYCVLGSEGLFGVRCSEIASEYNELELARFLISGYSKTGQLEFGPLPNLMMVRDIAVFVNDHIIICRPAKAPRRRETLLFHLIVQFHPMFCQQRDKLISLEARSSYFDQNAKSEHLSMEGGDFMMVAQNHLLIGVSERTTAAAAWEIMKILLEKRVVEKVSLVFLPEQRYCMHLDTVLTQVSRALWVLFEPLLAKPRSDDGKKSRISRPDQIRVKQFYTDDDGHTKTREFECILDLLKSVSHEDLNCDDFDVIYCADGEFPADWREQWTDGCNTFAVREEVVFMYDRNRQTIEAFRKRGFNIQTADDLLKEFEAGKRPDDVEKTVILLDSSELSRARGGPHCMTLPIERLAVWEK